MGRKPVVIDGGVAAYLSELQVAGRSVKTLKARRQHLAGWLAWLAAQGLDPSTATRDDAIAWLAGFSNPETRGTYRAGLRGYHAWMAATGRRADDPMAGLPSVHRPPGHPHPCPDAVVRAVLDRGGDRDRAMILLGRFAGLRCCEIAAAHARDLAGPPGLEVIRLRGKGGRVREVPCHPTLAALYAAGGWVVPSERGGHLQPDTVSARLSVLLHPWTAHSLRHAFATEAYARTHDLRLVQTWLGHASPETTCIYVGVEQDFDAIRSLRLAS